MQAVAEDLPCHTAVGRFTDRTHRCNLAAFSVNTCNEVHAGIDDTPGQVAAEPQRSPGDAILCHMKVEEIAEAVAKLPPDQLARFAAGDVQAQGRPITLLLLANFGKEGRPEPIIAKVSQETLAEMIGTTRSRVSFFMNKFLNLGLIDYNGGIEIHSSF